MTQPPLCALPARLGVRALIQCAMEMEAAPFMEALGPGARVSTVGDASTHTQTFATGEIDGSTVMVVTSGIGLVNAASATARALMLVDPDVVIAAGTTGGLGVDVEVGDIAVGTATLYSAADATAFGYAPGQVPGMPTDYHSAEIATLRAHSIARRLNHHVHVGQIVSADSFVTAASVDEVRRRFPEAIATDMETCAMAQVCFTQGISWVSLRAVSDLCGPRADQDFHMDSSAAARHSFEAVRAYLAL